LLPVGIALGPEGLRLFSADILSYLDPAVSAALAALGVLIGLGLDMRRPHEGRLLGAATVEAGFTMLLVGAGVMLVGPLRPVTDMPVWLVALIVGTCASVSSTTPATDSSARHAVATRIGDLDDVLPIVLGGVALALIRATSPSGATWLTVQAIGLALAVAVGGWLLVAQSSSESEQRVFTAGTVLLLGGVAEFLSLSALLAGLIAGMFWSALDGDARDRIARDVRHMQHPLVVLLLLIAGARVGFSPGLGGLVVAYLILRITGKIAGGWLARRMVATELPSHLGLYLISPGVIAVAFALNAVQAAGDRAGAILAIVVVGSIGSELLALFVRPTEAST
jgi:hypothetical protein